MISPGVLDVYQQQLRTRPLMFAQLAPRLDVVKARDAGRHKQVFEIWGHLDAEMRSAAEAAGRDPDAIEITVGGARDADEVRRKAPLGASRVTIRPPAFDPDGLREGLERFAASVMDVVGRD